MPPTSTSTSRRSWIPCLHGRWKRTEGEHTCDHKASEHQQPALDIPCHPSMRVSLHRMDPQLHRRFEPRRKEPPGAQNVRLNLVRAAVPVSIRSGLWWHAFLKPKCSIHSTTNSTRGTRGNTAVPTRAAFSLTNLPLRQAWRWRTAHAAHSCWYDGLLSIACLVA